MLHCGIALTRLAKQPADTVQRLGQTERVGIELLIKLGELSRRGPRPVGTEEWTQLALEHGVLTSYIGSGPVASSPQAGQLLRCDLEPCHDDHLSSRWTKRIEPNSARAAASPRDEICG